MKKLILAALFVGLFAFQFTSCNNGGGGEECPCAEGSGVATETVQGDIHYCDQRRATGECRHTRDCDAKKKKSAQ